MSLSSTLDNLGRAIAYYPKLTHVTGGVGASIFLCQMIYWLPRTKDPDGVYKTQVEIEDETGLSEREQNTARKLLREKGLLVEKKKGLPCRIYFNVNRDRLDELWNHYVESGESEAKKRRQSKYQASLNGRNVDTSSDETSNLEKSSFYDSQELQNVGHRIDETSELSVTNRRNNLYPPEITTRDYLQKREEGDRALEEKAGSEQRQPVLTQLASQSHQQESSGQTEELGSGSESSAPIFPQKKIPAQRDHFGDRCNYPGHKYPALAEQGLGHLWTGPGWNDFSDSLKQACHVHLKKRNLPCDDGDVRQYIRNAIRYERWGDLEDREGEARKLVEARARNEQAIAASTAAAAPITNHQEYMRRLVPIPDWDRPSFLSLHPGRAAANA